MKTPIERWQLAMWDWRVVSGPIPWLDVIDMASGANSRAAWDPASPSSNGEKPGAAGRGGSDKDSHGRGR